MYLGELKLSVTDRCLYISCKHRFNRANCSRKEEIEEKTILEIETTIAQPFKSNVTMFIAQ